MGRQESKRTTPLRRIRRTSAANGGPLGEYSITGVNDTERRRRAVVGKPSVRGALFFLRGVGCSRWSRNAKYRSDQLGRNRDRRRGLRRGDILTSFVTTEPGIRLLKGTEAESAMGQYGPGVPGKYGKSGSFGNESGAAEPNTFSLRLPMPQVDANAKTVTCLLTSSAKTSWFQLCLPGLSLAR
jgi:hypothetical protein